MLALSSTALLNAGCEETGNSLCDPPCPPGLVCDLAQRRCVFPPGDSAPPTCAGALLYCRGQCVDSLADPNNCGACGNSCGLNAECSGGHCRCRGTFSNCNGFWSDGCECSGDCAGRTCAPVTPTGCDPSQPGACSVDQYCDRTTSQCLSCPPGAKNCDLLGDCECQGECDGAACRGTKPQCEATVKASCGDSASFCNTRTGECGSCINGFLNCDKVEFCECEGLCAGESCAACDATVAGACDAVGSAGVYCNGSKQTCQPCPAGKLNCDRTGFCECDGACVGTQCSTTMPQCSASKAGDCGDETKYCDASDKCATCPAGKKNCDLLGDCECEYSCDGTQCKPPCTYNDPDVCGIDNTQWCYNGACRSCTAGFFNCDHTQGCECQGGCVGTACAPSCTAATCTGCCLNDTCTTIAAQDSFHCGSNADPCVVCPVGQFCKTGACIDCNATNCPDGCCSGAGDCIPFSQQTDDKCGDNGAACASCQGAICIDGGCWI